MHCIREETSYALKLKFLYYREADLDDESDEAAELARGDVNDNGLIDIGDVSMIASYVKGVKEFPDETSELRADVNLDGMVNVKDMMRLAAVIKGIHPL